MRKIFTLMVMAVVAIAAGAQNLKYEFTSYCGKYYEAYQATVDSQAVINAIGCAPADAEAFVVLPDGTESSDLLGGTDGWRNAEGEFQSWSSSAYYYVKADFTKTPEISEIGGYPGNTETPADYSAKYRLKNGDKSIDIDIVLHYVETPKPVLADMTLVKPNSKLTIEQYPRTNTNATSYTLSLKSGSTNTGVLKIGLDWNEVDIADYIFIKQDVDGVTSDTLKLQDDDTYGTLLDDNSMETTELGYTSETGQQKITVSNFAYSGDTLSFSIAQVAGACKEGDSFTLPLYIVNPDTKQYAQITITFNCIANPVPEKPYSEMTCVGEETITLKRDISLGYSTTSWEFDADSIAALFGDGISYADLTYKALTSDGETLTDSYTTSATGFWMDMESHPISWNTSVQSYFADLEDGYFDIGHMPSVFDGGEKATGALLLTFGDKYYRFNIDIQIGDEPDENDKTPEESEIVAKTAFDYQIVPDASNYQDDFMSSTEGMVDLDINWIEEMIGTSAPTLYGYKEETDSVNGNTLAYSKQYSCDPSPGFWMIIPEGGDQEEYQYNTATVGSWGTNAFGICYADGVFQFFQFPGQRSIGDKYDADFFLQNPKEGKMIKVHFTVSYVESRTSIDFVGQSDYTIAASEDEERTAIDNLEEILTALGADSFEDISNTGTVKAALTQTTYVDYLNTDYYDDSYCGFKFSKDGVVYHSEDEDEELANVLFYLGVDEGEFVATVADGHEADFADKKTYTAKIVLEYDNKDYLCNVTVCSPETLAGISSVKAEGKKAEGFYNLAGQKVSSSYKGFVIQRQKDAEITIQDSAPASCRHKAETHIPSGCTLTRTFFFIFVSR